MTAATRILRRPLGVAPDTLPSVLHPVLRRVYAARSVAGAADLDHSLACLPPPSNSAGRPRRRCGSPAPSAATSTS